MRVIKGLPFDAAVATEAADAIDAMLAVGEIEPELP